MSIIRPTLKLRRGRVLVGLLTLSATAVVLAPTAANAGPRHTLVFKVTGQSRQNVIGAHGIAFAAHCPTEACTVVASATSKSPSLHTSRIRARVAAGSTSRLVLPLNEAATAKLSAALAAGRSPTFTIKATAKDAFGGKVPLTLTVRPYKS